jgi:voltage-gated potassium channel Kch
MTQFDTKLWSSLFTKTEDRSSGEAKPRAMRKKMAKVWLKGQLDWPIIIALAILAFCLGYWGNALLFLAQGTGQTLADTVYATIKLFSLSADTIGPLPIPLEVARFLAPASLSFVVIKTALGLFKKRLDIFRLKFARNHVIIAGLNEKGLNLVTDFLAKNARVVAFEEDENQKNVISAGIEGATVVIGNASEESDLLQSNVKDARYLISVTDDDNTNVEAALKAQEIAKKRKGKLKHALQAFIHLNDVDLLMTLKRAQSPHSTSIHFFGTQETAARLLFHRFPIDGLPETLNEDAPPVHLVVIGFGAQGMSIVLQAIRVGAFVVKKHPCITIIADDAEKKRDRFLHDYPFIGETCDLHFENATVSDKTFLDGTLLVRDSTPPVNAVVVCLDNDEQNLSCALTLPSILQSRQVPIYIHTKQAEGIPALINTELACYADSPKFIAFGSARETCTRELVVGESMYQIARQAHELYLSAELAKGRQIGERPSLNHWENLPESYKTSNLLQADHIPVKLRAIGCDIQRLDRGKKSTFEFQDSEIELLARMEHDRWMAVQYLDGWSYGETRDDGQKKHPDMLPPEDLPESILNNDKAAVLSIVELLGKLDIEIVRRT